jgi:hypothetical protein
LCGRALQSGRARSAIAARVAKACVYVRHSPHEQQPPRAAARTSSSSRALECSNRGRRRRDRGGGDDALQCNASPPPPRSSLLRNLSFPPPKPSRSCHPEQAASSAARRRILRLPCSLRNPAAPPLPAVIPSDAKDLAVASVLRNVRTFHQLRNLPLFRFRNKPASPIDSRQPRDYPPTR